MTRSSRPSAWLVAALALVLLSAALPAPAAAQGRPAGAAAERRIALVIGNAAYQTSPLRNPTNDAQDMAGALKAMGFTVTLRTDADQRQMKQAIREFGAELRQGAIALFYFAGHGIQARGKNFLIPVRAQIESEPDLEDAAVDLGYVLSFMEDAKNNVNLVILDACRNNPFGRGLRSGTRGLAQVDAARGTLIAFATSPGSVALDGSSGRNGVYTKHLLESLRASESDVERVFKRVRKGVYQETSGQQVPWESSSLIGDFAFGMAGGGTARPAPAPTPAPAPAIDPTAFETALWNEIKDRNQPSEMRAYLQQYPNGRYAVQARSRLAQAPAPTPPPAHEGARRMLGTWTGYYGYNEGRQANVPFKLTITTINGADFTGMISEPATFGDGSSRFLFARVRGRIEAGRVQFVKTYDGTGGQTHSVAYQGNLDGEGVHLKGGWTIEQRGRTAATGFFAAAQQ